MTKRTFVLFLCLVQVLALWLLPQQSNAWYNDNFGITKAVSSENPLLENVSACEDFCEDECLENTPIVQAHEAEWKENLSDLLRHRHSNYRFVTFESVSSVTFHFAVRFRVFCQKIQPSTFFKRVVTLPDYYSFLHRLCPF